MNMLTYKMFLAFIFSGMLCMAQRGYLRAGVAPIEISPTSAMLPMGGVQSFKSIHDSLYARALVIDNGISNAAIVSLDLGSVPGGDDLVNIIASELKIKPEYVLLHNHNAPTGGRGNQPGALNLYYELVKKGTHEAVRLANSRLRLADVGFATDKAYINTNRDEKIGNDYRIGYNPDCPSDKTVAVVSFIDHQTSEPLAIYSNYTVHAVVMFRAKTKDMSGEITGDLPGATSNYVEAHFNNAIALWTSGAAGDQNPIFMANYNQDHQEVQDTGAGGYAIRDVLSRRLGEEIVRLTKSIANTRYDVEIWGNQNTVSCPGQRNSRSPAAPGTHVSVSTVNMVDGDPIKIPLSLLMINDIALLGISGELYTEIGQDLKRTSKFDRTDVVTHILYGVGYIATDAAYLFPAEKTVANRIKSRCAASAIRNGMVEYLLHRNAAISTQK
jgi:neutral ceramidase